MVYSILLTLDVLLAIGLIVLVLLQHGKGADAGAAFGSGASATVFGARGSASFLSRATAILATLFFINSLGLAFIVSHRPADRSIVDQLADEPAVPAAPAQDSLSADDPSSVPTEDVPAADVPADNGAAQDVPAGDVPSVDKPAGADAKREPRASSPPGDVPR